MIAPQRAIGIRDLVVNRGGRLVLAIPELAVATGSVTGLLGPSGCGKTTLMRAVMGLQRCTGEVSVLGRPAGSRELRGRIGYVTQAPSVYLDLSARDNLRYFAAVLGARRDEVDEVLGRIGMSDAADRRVDQLSGGQRARVSLGAALLGRPALLVLDEPTVGLDPLLRRTLWQLFAQLAEGGTTLLVSSHVMDEAEHCTDLILLREGRVIGRGSPQRLKQSTGEDDIEGAFLSLVRR